MPTPPGSTVSPTTGSASWAGSGISSSSTSSTRTPTRICTGTRWGAPIRRCCAPSGPVRRCWPTTWTSTTRWWATPGASSAVRPTSPRCSRRRRPTPGAPAQRAGAPGSWRATTTGTRSRPATRTWLSGSPDGGSRVAVPPVVVWARWPFRRPCRSLGGLPTTGRLMFSRSGRRSSDHGSPGGGVAVPCGRSRRHVAAALRRAEGGCGSTRLFALRQPPTGPIPRRTRLPCGPHAQRRHRHQCRLHGDRHRGARTRAALVGHRAHRDRLPGPRLRTRRRRRAAGPVAGRGVAGGGVARPHGGRRQGVEPAPGRAGRLLPLRDRPARLAAARARGLLRGRRGDLLRDDAERGAPRAARRGNARPAHRAAGRRGALAAHPADRLRTAGLDLRPVRGPGAVRPHVHVAVPGGGGVPRPRLGQVVPRDGQVGAMSIRTDEAAGRPARVRRRLLLVAAALLAVVLVVVVLWLGRGDADTAGTSAPASPTTSVATPTTAAPTVTPPAPVATGEPVVADELPPNLPPVDLDEAAEVDDGIAVSLEALKAIQGTGIGPGNVAGPALRVTVRIENRSGDPVRLDAVAVNLTSGEKH